MKLKSRIYLSPLTGGEKDKREMQILERNFTRTEPDDDMFNFDYIIKPTHHSNGTTYWDQFYRRAADWQTRPDGSLPPNWIRLPLDRGIQGIYYPIQPFLRDSDPCVTHGHVTWTVYTPPRVVDIPRFSRDEDARETNPKPFMALRINNPDQNMWFYADLTDPQHRAKLEELAIGCHLDADAINRAMESDELNRLYYGDPVTERSESSNDDRSRDNASKSSGYNSCRPHDGTYVNPNPEYAHVAAESRGHSDGLCKCACGCHKPIEDDARSSTDTITQTKLNRALCSLVEDFTDLLKTTEMRTSAVWQPVIRDSAHIRGILDQVVTAALIKTTGTDVGANANADANASTNANAGTNANTNTRAATSTGNTATAALAPETDSTAPTQDTRKRNNRKRSGFLKPKEERRRDRENSYYNRGDRRRQRSLSNSRSRSRSPPRPGRGPQTAMEELNLRNPLMKETNRHRALVTTPTALLPAPLPAPLPARQQRWEQQQQQQQHQQQYQQHEVPQYNQPLQPPPPIQWRQQWLQWRQLNNY